MIIYGYQTVKLNINFKKGGGGEGQVFLFNALLHSE